VAIPPPGRFDAQRLREARVALGLSQVQLAQRMGVDPGVLNSWETRGARPSAGNLGRVAFALGLSVSDLYLSDSDAVGTLVDLRVQAGLTQRQLAAELGVSQARVSRWERGLVRPTPNQAGRYAVIVGCDEDTLSAAIDRPRPAKRGLTREKVVREALEGAPLGAALAAPGRFGAKVALSQPEVRYRSVGGCEYDSCMEWLAELVMCHFGEDGFGDPVTIVVGELSFLTIRLNEESVWATLDSLSGDAEMFGELFEADYVKPEVAEQFSELPFNSVLILMNARIAQPVRGHNLGAWMAAEIIARMASATDTLVLAYPHPAGPPFDGTTEERAVRKLRRHWMKIGLTPIDEYPHVMGQSTAYAVLNAARAQLSCEHLEVPVDLSHEELRVDSEAWPASRLF